MHREGPHSRTDRSQPVLVDLAAYADGGQFVLQRVGRPRRRHPDDQAHASRIEHRQPRPLHYRLLWPGAETIRTREAGGVVQDANRTFASARFGFKAPLLWEPYGTIIGQAELSIADGDKLYQSNNVAVAMTHWLNFGDPKPSFCARFNTTRSYWRRRFGQSAESPPALVQRLSASGALEFKAATRTRALSTMNRKC